MKHTITCLLVALGAASSCLAYDLQPRPDNMYWVSDAPGADFDEKLQACYEASDKATPDLIRIHIDWTGDSWVMKRPVDWRPRHGTQLRVWMTGDDMWRLIDWQGPGGTTSERLHIWRFTGLKESKITGLKGIGHANYVAWIVQATDQAISSSGNNHFYRCRWQPWDGTVGNVGFWVGWSADRTGHNDHSVVQLEQCDVSFYPSGSSNNNGANGVMDTNCVAGHRAFVFSGYNTTANSMRDCATVNCWGVTTQGFQGQDPGGSSLVVDNFGSSGSPLVYDTFIGSCIEIHGGRHELGGQFLLRGFPQQPNDNAGIITITGTQIEDFRPEQAAPYLRTSSRAIVSVHDASQLIMSGVRVWCIGDLGQTVHPDWLQLWCDKPAVAPVVTLMGVVAGNGAGVNYKPVKTTPLIKGGTWKKVIDGSGSTVIKTTR